MKRLIPHHSRWTPGFTLVEVTLALAIIAIALVALLGLLPAGLGAARDAGTSTVVGVVLEDLHDRLKGQVLKPGPADFSPAYFDTHGVFIPANASDEEKANRLYRADVRIGEYRERPKGTSSLHPVTVEISWPVDVVTGEPARGNPKTSITYGVGALTGPDWSAIDSTHQEKIEF